MSIFTGMAFMTYYFFKCRHVHVIWKRCNASRSMCSFFGVLQQHPDKNPNDSESHQKFVALQEAYSVLSNASEKELYDLKQSYYSHHNPANDYSSSADNTYRCSKERNFYEQYQQSQSKERRERTRHDFHRQGSQRHYTDSKQYQDFYQQSWRRAGGFYSQQTKQQSQAHSRCAPVCVYCMYRERSWCFVTWS